MNDPIKNFVRQHREEFDDLEPSFDVLNKVRKKIGLVKISKRRNKIYRLSKWVVAASILIAFGIYLFDMPKEDFVVNEISKNRKTITPKLQEETVGLSEKRASVTAPEIVKSTETSGIRKSEDKALTTVNVVHSFYQNEKDSILLLLSDEKSSSSRICGLVKANKLSNIEEGLMEAVAKRATEDENSNVRLAAIEVIVSRLDRPYMVEILRKTFVEQDDPFVQTELIDVISNMNTNILDPRIKDKLLALTEDPTTMGFIKDRAYAVLMDY